MISQSATEKAVELARIVTENGRVEDSTLIGEIEFECEEQGLQNCEEIVEAAKAYFGES